MHMAESNTNILHHSTIDVIVKLISYLRSGTLGALFLHFGIVCSILLFVSIIYFYAFLPNTTNHGQKYLVNIIYILANEIRNHYFMPVIGGIGEECIKVNY